MENKLCKDRDFVGFIHCYIFKLKQYNCLLSE